MSKTEKRNRQKQAKNLRRKIWRFITLGVIVIVLMIVAAFFIADHMKWASIHKKAVAIGFVGAPKETEERHVWISEHEHQPNKRGDVPVRIMFRVNEKHEWESRGMGTRPEAYPDSLVSAYHVFEGTPGQYGWRKIGPGEFTGQEKIFPIVSCKSMGQADDAIVCSIRDHGDFPVINVPTSTTMFRDWEYRDYDTTGWKGKIRLLTYPEQEIQAALYIEVKPGVFHVLFDWDVVEGESGTGAIIEEEGMSDAYLIIIRSQMLPEAVADRIPQAERERIHWSKGKLYGVGNLVRLNPPKVPKGPHPPKG